MPWWGKSSHKPPCPYFIGMLPATCVASLRDLALFFNAFLTVLDELLYVPKTTISAANGTPALCFVAFVAFRLQCH